MATLFLPVERNCGESEDRISELPDDILMSFVSTMGMKEAAKTSILSKRWRYVWAKGTHLDFNHSIILPDFNEYFNKATRDTMNKYINWVNQVVDLHSSPCINTFRVCFAFERSDAHHIDKWVRFAISKQVKNLELSWLINEKFVYTLPFDVVKPSLDVNGSGNRFLQSLYLNKINVSGDILEYVLAQCRFLERLHIQHSNTLVRLKVVDLCRKLKNLTILFCCNLEQVEIEAVNLVYLHMGGKDLWSKVVLKNTPNLVDAMFWGPCFSDVAPIFRQNSQLAQISKLSLYVTLDVLSPESLPTFCNLKQLTLMVYERFEDELIASIYQFLKACPKLREFKVEFTDVYGDSYDEAYQLKELDSSNDDDDDDKTENVRDWEYFEMSYNMELGRKGHSNLREFLVAGFYGCDEDVELILFIVLISCNLETIICDCSHAHTDDGEVTPEVKVLKSRAAKLVKVIPPKITLAVI